AVERRRHESGLLTRAIHEVQVHAAHLLHPPVLGGVEPDDLVASFFRGVRLSDKRRRVVARALRLARSAWRRAGVFSRQPYRDWLNTAREVRPRGRGDEQIAVGI